jgi:hydroxypyruvate reductase
MRPLAIGKAWQPMAHGLEQRLGPPSASGLAIGPVGVDPLEGWECLHADHPLPTPRNLVAAQRVLEWIQRLSPSDALLVLLSGGASAMLCLPRPPLTLADLVAVTDALLRAGAPIEELNAVRKHAEVLKGGGLAAACPAGRIVTLILSDVLGDRLDVIGSGPTAPDPTTFTDALAVLDRRGALDAAPALTALLRRGVAGREPETVKPGDPLWLRVENIVIGNNRLALDAACAEAAARGYVIAERREMVQGDAADAGRTLARAALGLRARRPACIAWGGETTVTVGAATGRGGRNQELALAAALALEGQPGVTILSLATDGRDGPTDAAGAIVDGDTARQIRAAGLDPADALRRHDSYTALDAAGALLRTGPTGTNVNDIMLALID